MKVHSLLAFIFVLVILPISAFANSVTLTGPDGTYTKESGRFNISAAGNYTLTSENTNEDANVHLYIDVGSEDDVHLTLNGVRLVPYSSSYPGHAGIYCISGNITINLAPGTDNLCKGSKAKAGISILKDNCNIIIDGTGSLTAIGSSASEYNGYSHSYHYAPGIHKAFGSSTLTINSGVITAEGANYSAGIGGGYSYYHGANGGTSSYSYGNTNNIVINGGDITAISYGGAAGIGGSTGNGKAENIIFTGGSVVANAYDANSRSSGDAIGSGDSQNASSGIRIEPAANTVITATAAKGSAQTVTWSNVYAEPADITSDLKSNTYFTLTSVVTNSMTDLPKTGDNSNLSMWIALMIMEFGVLCTSFRKRYE